MKLKIQRRDVPLMFAGVYYRHNAPSLTFKAINGEQAEKELDERYEAFQSLVNLSIEELHLKYWSDEGASYVFNYVLRPYLEDPEESMLSCDLRGYFISFDVQELISEILADYPKLKNLQNYEIRGILHQGFVRLVKDKVILDFRLDSGPPKCEHYWSIFLT